jgi:predicted ATPase
MRRPQNTDPAPLATPPVRSAATGSSGVLSSFLRKIGLVTILGPGGIGKTTVALEVANELGGSYADGTCFVDLGRVTSADQACLTIMEALDGAVEVEASFEQLLLMLRRKRLLLILDSADHVTETVARFVERAMSETDHTDILVTTRESLRVESEALWRLQPLETPPASLRLAATDIHAYPAMELFVRTARRGAFDCQIDDATADIIAEVCRRLDGIPLAIELAASNVGVLGVDEVCRRLDDRCAMLGMERRTGVFRQRSMAATIDWSYKLLPEKEKAVLRRLATFGGAFSMQAAISVASDGELGATAVREAVSALTNKSFLVLDQPLARPRYRMLKTIRAYACQAQDLVVEGTRAGDHCARHLLDLRKQLNYGAAKPAAKSTPQYTNVEHLSEISVALNWNAMNEFMLRRLASFHRVREPGAVRPGFAIGSDRSGRIPFA